METYENEDFINFIKTFKKQIEKAYKKKGMSGVHDLVLDNLEKWKNVPFNIAATGNIGVGKSSLINTFLGIYADDSGGAEADVVECTSKPTPYKHKRLGNLILWDLPGIGSSSFTRENYLEKVNFQRYDFFIIVSASRFTDNDLWLAKAIKNENSKDNQEVKNLFYFVRTKVDVDITSQQKGHRREVSPEKVVARIRSEIDERLQKADCSNITSLFSVENYEKDKYDFDLLASALVNDTQEEKKRDALALSLSVLTENIIVKKEEAFRKRVWAICIASAAGGATPIPGTSAILDGMLLLSEAREYRKQFQLNDEGLSKLERILGIQVGAIARTLNLKSTAIVLTIRGLASVFSLIALSECIENVTKFSIPVVGSFIAGGISFFSTKRCLESLLDMMVSDAKKINIHLKETFKQK